MSSSAPTARRRLAGTACGLLALGSSALAQVGPPSGLPVGYTPDDPPGLAVVQAPAAPGGTAAATSPTASPTGAAPSAGGGPGSPTQGAPEAGDDGDVFKKVPPARPTPRPGFFPIPPTGPGYYSLADALTGTWRENPPKYPYPRYGLMPTPFYDADFRYLDDPNNTETDLFDPLKRVRLGDDWLFSTGGQTWSRSMNEYNSRLTARDNTYLLNRARVYGDLWYRDELRLFAELIGAYSSWQDLPPLPIDRNKADFQNLFVDLKAGEWGGKPAYVRVGRQELLYGSQRLVSPPDWANTRRTFQGVKAFRQGETVDVDLWWVQPVVPNADRLDSVDNNQNFVGAWATYRPQKGRAVDLYYLLLDNTNNVRQLGLQRGRDTLHTFGSRYVGDLDGTFLWDVEGAMQLGRHAGQDVVAGMGTAGVGYHWKDVPLTPTVWAYYDYASGDDDPAGGTFHTFHQLFPFGHYYFGWADQVGRQNVHDLNVHLHLYPAKWVQVQLQFHRFWLAASRDALYNAFGNAVRRDPTGAAGRDVGHELDVIVNVHLTKHADLLTGYSHLYGGDFLRRTAGPTGAADTGLFWLMLNYRW